MPPGVTLYPFLGVLLRLHLQGNFLSIEELRRGTRTFKILIDLTKISSEKFAANDIPTNNISKGTVNLQPHQYYTILST